MSPRRRASVRAGRSPATHAPAGGRALFDPRELGKLVGLMEERGLVELEIEGGGERVRLVRGRVGEVAAPEIEASARPTRSARRSADADGGVRPITSPMVGTFHRAPAPEVPAFVEVGDVVERGQVLCLVEAMKMMNDIEAEFRGRVVEILVESGRPVEYGEPIFLVEPV